MLGDMKAGIKFRTVDGPASRQAEHGNDGFRVLESFREIEVIAVNASDVNGPPARICERSLRIFKLRMLIPVMIDEHARESDDFAPLDDRQQRSEEHTSELQSLMSISYAVFRLKKKTKHNTN